MTLSFTTHWRDRLPGFYTSLAPTPLDNARLIWRNTALAQTLGVPETLFNPQHGAGVRWRRSIAAINLASGPASLATGAEFCLASSSCRMVNVLTGILKAPV